MSDICSDLLQVANDIDTTHPVCADVCICAIGYIEELEAERDSWKAKNSAAIGLLNKLGEKCKRDKARIEELEGYRANDDRIIRGQQAQIKEIK
jgi:hypothetical protein